jgi:demethylmenaquinone methyltransferase/2-methoxy-6-polyprenyl-1,4-benzoquinol methylase
MQSYKNKLQIEQMFDRISYRYDLLNHFLSIGIDIIWRKKMVKELCKQYHFNILDIATGTGDMAIMLAKKIPNADIIGIDISKEMLNLARKKILLNKLDKHIKIMQGDCEQLPFRKLSFEAITVAFGIRNFENFSKGLSEIFRVLKVSGSLFILEFSIPTRFPIKQLYHLYTKYILPFIGKILSKDRTAYFYLTQSVYSFPYGQAMESILKKIGFYDVKIISLSFGIATIYIAKKI